MKFRTRIAVLYRGEKLSLRKLSEATGICVGTLKARYRKGERDKDLWQPVHEKHGAPAVVALADNPRRSREQAKRARLKAENARDFSLPLVTT